MRNTYYLIFIFSLVAAQTKPMITSNSADYYNLNNMPEDILKEIVLPKSDTFDQQDLKTVKYYENFLKSSINTTLNEYGLQKIKLYKQYSDIIKSLSCTNKKLNSALACLIAQLNSMPKNTLLRLDYFNTFNIILCSLNYTYFVDQNKYCFEFTAKIQYSEKNQAMFFSIISKLNYFLNESEKVLFPKAVELFQQNPSLGNAQNILEKISKEGFDFNDTNKIQKCINIFNFFSTIDQSNAGVDKLLSNGGKINMCAWFNLWLSQKN